MSLRLRMKFGLNSGDDRIISLNNPKANLDAAAVSGAMNAMVAAGNAFADPLASAKRAELIETNTTVLVNNEE